MLSPLDAARDLLDLEDENPRARDGTPVFADKLGVFERTECVSQQLTTMSSTHFMLEASNVPGERWPFKVSIAFAIRLTQRLD